MGYGKRRVGSQVPLYPRLIEWPWTNYFFFLSKTKVRIASVSYCIRCVEVLCYWGSVLTQIDRDVTNYVRYFEGDKSLKLFFVFFYFPLSRSSRAKRIYIKTYNFVKRLACAAGEFFLYLVWYWSGVALVLLFVPWEGPNTQSRAKNLKCILGFGPSPVWPWENLLFPVFWSLEKQWVCIVISCGKILRPQTF